MPNPTDAAVAQHVDAFMAKWGWLVLTRCQHDFRDDLMGLIELTRAQAPAAGEWLPMTEAPFGEDVLVIAPGGFQQVAMQVDFDHWATRNGHYVRPIMWQRLPALPAMTAGLAD